MMYILFALAIAVMTFFIGYRRKTDTRTGNFGLDLTFSLILFVFFAIVNYFGLPVLNPWGFHAFWIEITVAVVAGGIISHLSWDHTYSYDNWIVRWIPTGIVLIIAICALISSVEMGRSDRFQKMLPVVEAADSIFNSEMHPIPVEKMCLVPYEIAQNRARKVLGDVPGLASRIQLGKMTKQTLTADFVINKIVDRNGNVSSPGQRLVFDKALLWVAPLEHVGFWKWVANDVTPGYVIVDATDATKTYLVQTVNGRELKLRYLESGCWGDYIERHIRNNGYADEGLTDYCFELDHDGQPHWVLANYEKTIGFSGADVKGIITVNVETGEIQQYSIEDSPSWADRVQPEQFISQQIDWWGQYKNGYWNSLFSETDVELATKCMSLVDVEGGSYWYTGVRSSGASDDATSGFMLVDSKTKKAMLYRISGISETRAMYVAQKLSIAGGEFFASNPILYNIGGIETYFMLLRRGDAVIGYCFVAVKDEESIAYAEHIKDAEKLYLKKCLERKIGAKVIDGALKNIEPKEYVIDYITNEGDMYYLRLKGEKGKEFYGSSKAFRELRWSERGHKILISFGEGESGEILIDTFDNIDIEI